MFLPNKFFMQKKYTLIALALFAGAFGSAVAQRAQPALDAKNLRPAVRHNIPALLPETTAPTLAGSVIVTHSGVNYRSLEETIGTTTWDAQSYGSLPPRVYSNNKGEAVANWLFSLQDANQTDRGTAQNVRVNGAWGAYPAARVEAPANRTGFPGAVRLGDGTEVIISHNTGQTPFKLWMAKKAPGATAWTEKAIPGPTGIGMLWPNMAVGGANKDVLHVIGITTPTANVPGVIYQGMNGHPLYFRSKDGGTTWDKAAVILPGIDKNQFSGIQANNYVIAADGDNVAVAVFSDWNDLFILKSTDGGDTWTKKMIFNFPDKLQNYTGKPALEYDSLDLVYPSPVTGANAINTTDGFGTMLVDASGEAHLWVGRSIVVDANFTDTTTSYYPTANGIWYWKESFGEANVQLIGGAFDYDGNDAINVTSTNFSEFPFYGNNCLSSFPTASLASNGDIFLVYSAINEQYAFDGAYYHTLYAMRSTNGGASWGDVVELTTKDYVDEGLIGLVESVWPSMPPVTGDKLQILYQQDFTPGCNIWGASHAIGENYMNWIEVDTSVLPRSPLVGISEPKGLDPAFALKISPNPVTSMAQLSATLRGAGPARVEVFDLYGKRVQELLFPVGNGAGRQHLSLPVQNLQNGTYFVRVSEGTRFSFEKFVKM